MICAWLLTGILAISLTIAYGMYVDFGHSILAFIIGFAMSGAIMLLTATSVYMIIAAVCTVKQRQPLVEECHSEIREEESADQPAPLISEEHYAERNQQHLTLHNQEQTRTVEAILRYTEHTFAPFLELDALKDMLADVEAWCHNPNHKPHEADLKYIADFSQRLKVLDLKHYVWNIGIRLGSKNGYTGEARARFIKAMFPTLTMDNTISSLCNQTHDPDRGHIVIDSPKLGSVEFNTMVEAA